MIQLLEVSCVVCVYLQALQDVNLEAFGGLGTVTELVALSQGSCVPWHHACTVHGDGTEGFLAASSQTQQSPAVQWRKQHLVMIEMG